MLPLLVALLALPQPPAADPIATIDHRVKHRSAVPGFEGQEYILGIRERVPPKPNGEAVLCIHGLTIPGEPVFDLTHKDYSWLRALAAAGYRAFAADMTGYGSSTRPPPMNDPKNVGGLDRITLGISGTDRPYPYQVTTADSDLHDIDTAVEFVRRECKVERVHLVGTSLGGGRVLVYAARHPEKVGRVVVQGWGIAAEVDSKPAKLPAPGVAIDLTTEKGFKAKWSLMTRRKGQVEPGMPEVVWTAIQATDPVGAKWGPGVMRAPGITLYGWNMAVWAGVKAPVLLIHGEYDPLDPPGNALYQRLQTTDKVDLTFDGVSHVPFWETGKERLFAASVEWLGKGTFDGRKLGEVRVSVDGKLAWK